MGEETGVRMFNDWPNLDQVACTGALFHHQKRRRAPGNIKTIGTPHIDHNGIT